MTKARRIALFNLFLFKMTKSIKILTFIIIFTLSASPPNSPNKPTTVIMAQNQASNSPSPVASNSTTTTTTIATTLASRAAALITDFGQQVFQASSSPGEPTYDRESTMLLYRDDPTPYFQSEGSSIFNDKMTFDDYLARSMKSLLAVAGFDNDLHRYDNHKDLVRSVPSLLGASTTTTTTTTTNNNNNNNININNDQQKSGSLVSDSYHLNEPQSEYAMQMKHQRQCGLHLDMLMVQHRKLTATFKSYSYSTNLNLIELFDSFGSPQDSVMRGSYYWTGSYDQCMAVRLYLPVFNQQSIHNLFPTESPIQVSDQTTTSSSNSSTTNNNIANSLMPLAPAIVNLVASSLSASGDQSQRRGAQMGSTGSQNGGPGSINNVKQMVKTRYCIANFRSPNWLNNSLTQDYPGSFSIKIGVCLPETCNSLSIKNYRPQLEKLIKSTRLTQLPYSEYHMTGLYCLPDERSELRQLSPSAWAFIAFVISWALLVIFYTLKYELYLYNKSKRLSINLSSCRSMFDQSPSMVNVTLARSHQLKDPSKLMKIFSLRLSWNKLFEKQAQIEPNNSQLVTPTGSSSTSTSVPGSPHITQVGNNLLLQPLNLSLHLEAKMSHPHGRCNGDDLINDESKLYHVSSSPQSNGCTIRAARCSSSPSTWSSSDGYSSSVTTTRELEKKKSHIIDLSAIDGIKVISMIWLIAAHSLLFFIRSISNGRDFWSILKDARFTTIMAGIFPVDTFFTITGILTAYLKFRKDDGKAMSKVRYWLDAFVHRYFRFMPMYLVIYWYTKEVSQYLGSGPLWDYGTANTSLRSVCKEESWAVPIFFGANFKPLNEHCVKPAWYLANDFQYLLLTPFFLGLMMKSRLLGYTILVLIIVFSLVMQFLTVFFSKIEDFEVLANFKPMFGTYILSNLWRLYVLPYNRIPPYLIGLLTGHILYWREQRAKKKHAASSNESPKTPERRISAVSYSSGSSTSEDSSTGSGRNLDTRTVISQASPRDNKSNSRLIYSIVALISIIYLPLATKYVSQHGMAAKIVSSSLMPAMRFVWSLAIARLVFVCATRESSSWVSRFLSAPLWKPWSKVGLPALLIQWEIIIYLAQTQRALPEMNIVFLMGIILISIVVTYLLAVPVHLAYEYPWSSIERLYIHPIFNERSASISSSKVTETNDIRTRAVSDGLLESVPTTSSHIDFVAAS